MLTGEQKILKYFKYLEYIKYFNKEGPDVDWWAKDFKKDKINPKKWKFGKTIFWQENSTNIFLTGATFSRLTLNKVYYTQPNTEKTKRTGVTCFIEKRDAIS